MEQASAQGMSDWANRDTFFSAPDEEILLLLQDVFPQELDRLKRAYSVRGNRYTSPSTPSPSQILFGAQYGEVNRTLTGILSLRWLYNRDYEAFAGKQTGATRLTRESFDWLSSFFVDAFDDLDELAAVVTSMMINDLGKDAQLATDYRELTGEDISNLNHDMILLKAVDKGMVPCLDRLPASLRDDLISGLRLGADVNIGQLAQAENCPACLGPLVAMRDKPNAFRLHFMELILDVAGAHGHMYWTYARLFTEPVTLAYRGVWDAATSIISSNMSLRDAYDIILVRRAKSLAEMGFRSLDVHDNEDRALTRLMCLGGVAELEHATLFDDTWRDLEAPLKASLVYRLNLDGAVLEPAVQATYMPALLTQAVDAGGPGSREVKQAAMRSTLRYMARVLSEGVDPDGSVMVVERILLDVLKNVVQRSGFLQDPRIIETAEVPEGTPVVTA